MFLYRLLMKFAEKCPPGKRGRPMSKSPQAAEAEGIEVCEKETKSGKTVAYKTGNQLNKERMAKSETKAAREKLGLKAKGRLSKANLAKIQEIRNELMALRGINESKLESKIEEGNVKARPEVKPEGTSEQVKTEAKPEVSLKIEPKDWVGSEKQKAFANSKWKNIEILTRPEKIIAQQDDALWRDGIDKTKFKSSIEKSINAINRLTSASDIIDLEAKFRGGSPYYRIDNVWAYVDGKEQAKKEHGNAQFDKTKPSHFYLEKNAIEAYATLNAIELLSENDHEKKGIKLIKKMLDEVKDPVAWEKVAYLGVDGNRKDPYRELITIAEKLESGQAFPSKLIGKQAEKYKDEILKWKAEK